jgi:twitching motility protein PilJ
VQRLAERSSEATKQIGAIVKTIQTDTNSAVAAMEKSTEGVVEGARLSDEAGRALTEIETVTNNLARLIQSISAATEAQTQVASVVSSNMKQIQEITTLTTEGTKQTTASVGELTKLAEELRESVSGFKLA